MESPQQITRDNTMEATAKEGIKLKQTPEECKTVKESVKNGSGDAPEVVKNGNSSPAKLPTDNTTVTTAQEGEEVLEKQEEVNEEAKTQSTNGEEKSAQKRPAEAETEQTTEEPKKPKTDEEEKSEEVQQTSEEKPEKDEQKEAEATPAEE